MARGRRRKCKCCRSLFVPDPRNLRHQGYCSLPSCRAASKAASQARWLAKRIKSFCAAQPAQKVGWTDAGGR